MKETYFPKSILTFTFLLISAIRLLAQPVGATLNWKWY